MAWYGIAPGWQILALPVFVLLTFGLSLGLGLLLAALNVEYRDFRYVVPFIVQFGLFVSPVAFATARRAGDRGACSTRSIRWSGSSTGSAGRCSAGSRSTPARCGSRSP